MTFPAHVPARFRSTSTDRCPRNGATDKCVLTEIAGNRQLIGSIHGFSFRVTLAPTDPESASPPALSGGPPLLRQEVVYPAAETATRPSVPVPVGHLPRTGFLALETRS